MTSRRRRRRRRKWFGKKTEEGYKKKKRKRKEEEINITEGKRRLPRDRAKALESFTDKATLQDSVTPSRTLSPLIPPPSPPPTRTPAPTTPPPLATAGMGAAFLRGPVALPARLQAASQTANGMGLSGAFLGRIHVRCWMHVRGMMYIQ